MTSNTHTPNGYDPAWVEAINGVLADRESDVEIADINDALWEEFIGPMIDALERSPLAYTTDELDPADLEVPPLDELDPGCPECQRSNGPHYAGPCPHNADPDAPIPYILTPLERR